MDVCGRTIEIPQCTRIFKVNCCLKVHNVQLKIALSISGKDSEFSVQSVTGRERLIRSHSSARFSFELSGNSN